MRRILYTILACTALCVAVPAVALAHDGHSGHHHKRHHHFRHEKFVGHRHDRAFGNDMVAGTVTSFANNELTITLNNGNTVSGLVTDNTEVKCENPEDNNDNGDNDVEHGDRVADHGPGGGDNGGDNGDRGDDNGDRGDDNANNNNNMCTITPGMGVRDAELRVDGTGAVWDEVELVSSTSSSTGS